MKKNIIRILICIAIVISAFIFGHNGEFGGADGQIEETIAQVNEDYEPWFSSIWEPPSTEIESLLFALQAAIGAGFIGYYIGRKKNVSTDNSLRENKQ